jgi:hypothetical protein
MKILLRVALLTLLTLGLSYENTSAESVFSSKCLSYGDIKPNENPSFQQLNCLLTNAALDAGIPPEVVKAVASQENSWRQFNENGEPIISKDGGIGLMQITNQPNYDQEKLKYDIYYNIETGIKILSSMYDRTTTDLPKIKDAGRQIIENWYFPVMAYNGIKPVNSPLYQLSGERNNDAYQERVFTSIEQNSFLEDTELGQFPFKLADFQYDQNSDENIVFLKKEYTLAEPLHTSSYLFKKGGKIVVTKENVNVRLQPSATSASVKVLAKNTPLIINGNFTYDLSLDKKNQFVWYPVMTEDKKVGYISSAYTTTPTVSPCSQYHKNQKIYWDGVELKSGQIGRLMILQNTTLFKLDATKRTFARTLKKGELYRIYAFKPGILNVGGGYYVDSDLKVKYDTPSKTKLIAVKCIASF